MKELICQTCGSPLESKGDHYKCRYCDAIYVEEEASRFQEELESALESYKIESLAKARRTLYDAAHRRFPSQSAVTSAATSVLAISENDFLAKVYLRSYEGDPAGLVSVLTDASVSAAEANEAFSWLLPNLHPRCIGALKSFLERNLVDEALTKALGELEKEAEKVDEGIYDAGFPRDVFLCYSSSDLPKVIETMELLEQNGFTCFAAFRNLRTGRGAAEKYNDEIHKAMKACKCFVFLSSVASRSPGCDAVRIELPYLSSELPGKPRCEYILEDYSKQNVPLLAKRVIKEAFDGLQWVRGEEELVDRVLSLTSRPQVSAEKKEETPATHPCPSCGNAVPNLAKFCPHCGEGLDWGDGKPRKKTAPKPQPPATQPQAPEAKPQPQPSPFFNVPSDREEEPPAPAVRHPALSLSLKTSSGAITFKNGSSFSVSGAAYKQNGETIIATTVSDDIVVTLPPGEYGDLKVGSVSGAIKIDAGRSSFGQIQATSTSGSVYLDALSFASFRCKTVSGNLVTRRKYDNVSFSSVSGVHRIK